MLLVHKIELKPNNKQATYFAKACGVARFAYNWALGEWQKSYQNKEQANDVLLRRKLNAIKKEQFPWMQEVTKVAPQQAIKNLGKAFSRFFRKQGKYPRFKKKGVHDSFRADNGPSEAGQDAVLIQSNKIKLPRIGFVRLKEVLRFSGQIMSVTILRQATKWYAAISVETNKLPHERKNHGSVGVDLGIKALATLSNGVKVVGPKAHKKLLMKLRRLSKQLSRKVKRSNNYGKAKIKLAALHAKISNIRKDALHKLTTELVLNYITIGIEDLHVKGLAANRKLARHIMDQSFYEFRRQLEYKARWYKSAIIVASRFFPSSKQCCICGAVNNNLTLHDRDWTCDCCGTYHDRDLNAAMNLKNIAAFATKNTASSAEIYASRVEGSGVIGDAVPIA